MTNPRLSARWPSPIKPTSRACQPRPIFRRRVRSQVDRRPDAETSHDRLLANIARPFAAALRIVSDAVADSVLLALQSCSSDGVARGHELADPATRAAPCGLPARWPPLLHRLARLLSPRSQERTDAAKSATCDASGRHLQKHLQIGALHGFASLKMHRRHRAEGKVLRQLGALGCHQKDVEQGPNRRRQHDACQEAAHIEVAWLLDGGRQGDGGGELHGRQG